MRPIMDSVDEKIISLLQQNARISIKDIAAQVFLSSPAVTARIERLEKLDIIRGYHAQVNTEAFGYRIKAFVNVEMNMGKKADFFSYIEGVPNVRECNCVTGDYSMLLEVEFASTGELDKFVNELQKFGKTKTQIVFSTSIEHRSLPVRTPKEAAAFA